jgi:hypothetical protein
MGEVAAAGVRDCFDTAEAEQKKSIAVASNACLGLRHALAGLLAHEQHA